MFEVIVIILLLVIIAAVPGGGQALGGLMSSIWGLLGLVMIIGGWVWMIGVVVDHIKEQGWGVPLTIAILISIPTLAHQYKKWRAEKEKKRLDEVTDEFRLNVQRLELLKAGTEVEPKIYYHESGFYLVHVPGRYPNLVSRVRAFESIEGAREIADKYGAPYQEKAHTQSECGESNG